MLGLAYLVLESRLTWWVGEGSTFVMVSSTQPEGVDSQHVHITTSTTTAYTSTANTNHRDPVR